MKQFLRYFLGSHITLLALLLAAAPVHGQFKHYLDVDTNVIGRPSLFDAAEIIETGIPGQELAIGGAITGNDSTNTLHQTVYLMQVGYNGVPKRISFFEDPAYFLIFGPRCYGLCYDEVNNFYLALGSNDNQIILKSGIDGSYKWSRKVNHHAFYSVHMFGDSVLALGQDESIQGVHDYSLVRLDTGGTPSPGMMYGTVDFDVPNKMVVTDDAFIMAGHTFFAGLFSPMIIKADTFYNKVWSTILTSSGKDMACNDIATAPDGSGYVATGSVLTLTGGPDSTFVMKLDTAGTVQWCHFYGIDTVKRYKALGIAADPQGRGYLICGHYSQTNQDYYQPTVMMVDPNGVPLWNRDYGLRDTLYDEIMRDVIVRKNGNFFYSLAESAKIDTNNVVTKRIFLVKADLETGAIPCDSAISIGYRPATTGLGGSTHTEPFYADNPYPFTEYSGTMSYEIACSVYVSVPEPPLYGDYFTFVNPAHDVLDLEYKVGLDGGSLRLMDIRGQVLREFELQAGSHQEQHSLAGLAQGLYFLIGKGEGWDRPVKRLVISR